MTELLISKIIGGISVGILITALVAASHNRNAFGLTRKELRFKNWLRHRALRRPI